MGRRNYYHAHVAELLKPFITNAVSKKSHLVILRWIIRLCWYDELYLDLCFDYPMASIEFTRYAQHPNLNFLIQLNPTILVGGQIYADFLN